jgi:hypothetical protein
MTTAQDESRELRSALARLNARAWGIALGLLFGGGLFLATIVLIVRGGPNVGEHLSLLRAYFPGYSVTVVGSFIGFVYGFVLGYALGRVIGMVYNRIVTVGK